jgi:hypothetical protein
MSKIYNKNAREKALLEEAYAEVHQEWVAQAVSGAGRLLGKAGLTKVAAKKAAGKVGSAAVSGAAQGAKAGAAQKVQGMISGQPQPVATPEVPSEDEGAVDVELDHWWDFDEQDVVLKVYHGALRQLPPAAGTPAYETNSEKIFTWLKGKYPQPDDYDIDKVEFQSRTADDATEWALRQNKKDEEHDEYNPGYGKVEDAEMEFDERGFAKNTEAGREGENGDFGNRNLKDELEEIQNLVDDFLGMHFEAGDHDDIAKAIHHVKTLLSDITDDGKYSREPSNIGLPGAQY